MLDFDRRTVLLGSLVSPLGSESVSSIGALESHTGRRLRNWLVQFFSIDDESGWLLTERLKWRGKWPSLLVSGGAITPLAGLQVNQIACSSTLPSGAALAVYPRRLREITTWRRIPAAEVEVLGKHLSSFRSNGQLACLILPQGSSAPERVVVEV